MRKTVRTILIIVFAGVFVFSAARFLLLRREYAADREVYDSAADQFTKPSAQDVNTGSQTAASWIDVSPGQTEPNNAPVPEEPAVPAVPIEVDFAKLTSLNSSVIGWIYCEGTVINYPVVYGVDNSYYLDHDYTGAACGSGAIFTDAQNIKGFVDSNIVVYGHHMSDMSMFAILDYWQKQDYYNEHPVMWLLTPEQDYRVEIFAAYEAQADSSTYTIFRGPGPQLDNYLRYAAEKSGISTRVTLDPDARYVLLSTCAYGNALARSVVHAKLVPVNSAGGRAFN